MGTLNIQSGDPRIGVAGEVNYAPFKPRVAFTYFAESPPAPPEPSEMDRPQFFEKLPSNLQLPPLELAGAAEIEGSKAAGGIPLSEYQWNGPGRNEAVRRAVDQGISFIALLAVAPLLMIVALILRIMCGDRVFVHERRIGRFGREIDLLSFRTHTGSKPASIRFGRLLRRSGIFALPRLLNLFRGDLTLVGPRPVLEAELPRYGLDVIYYLSGRPGLTGEWQSLAARKVPPGARYLQERTYARTRTFRSDLKVLLSRLQAKETENEQPQI